MKKILLLLALLPFQLSAQEEWSFAESNYKISADQFYLSLRQRDLDSNIRDYIHAELGYKFSNLEVGYRYSVDDNGLDEDVVEKRWKFTLPLWESGPFGLKTRMEHRNFNIEDDYWRFRWMLEYDQRVTDELALWAIIQPRWKVQDDLTIDDWRNQFGISIGDGAMTFGPFLERYSKGDNQGLSDSLWFFGVNVGIKLM